MHGSEQTQVRSSCSWRRVIAGVLWRLVILNQIKQEEFRVFLLPVPSQTLSGLYMARAPSFVTDFSA